MFIIYKITNIINDKIYIGRHKTSNINDSYMGSGTAIKQAIRKYGKENFIKEVLYIFDRELDAIQAEIEIVGEQFIQRFDTYNQCVGGKGGFDYINRNRDLYPNPMFNEKVRIKQKETYKRNLTEERILKKRVIGQENIQKAIEFNKGKKRPNHSVIISQWNKQRWKNDYEVRRNSLASFFEVISPEGIMYKTNRLQEFCNNHNLGYISLWNTSRTNKPVKKGKSKGWICTKI